METLVWIGAAITLLGLAGILWCIREAMSARRSAAPEEEVRARLQRVVAVNLGALGVSALGLILVVAGIML